MAASENVDWDVCERCAEEGGVGICLPTGEKCWAHADDQDLDAALKRLGEGGRLDARGVPITQKLLERLLQAAPKDEHGRPILTNVRFGKATFHDAGFGKATFQGMSEFDETTFQGTAWFYEATFHGMTVFVGATFHGLTEFGATFRDVAAFDEATFQRNAGFSGANFQRDVWFDGATFRRDARFLGATFRRDVWFRRAIFQRDVRFDRATFQQARQLGPMLVRKALVLNGAIFQERAQIEVSAAALCCRRARFMAGVQLRVRWAQIILDDADLAAPSILAGVPPFPDLDEGRWAQALERLLPQPRLEPDRRWKPRLLSVRRADVAGLTVATVDLRACQFADAHNLDKLRIETVRAFAHTPRGWRWAARQALTEEHHWRHERATSRRAPWRISGADARSQPHRDHDRTWSPSACQPPSWVAASQPLAPTRIASIYRALRKGREDNKDEPGAADFYYGEMEMRRHAKREEATAQRQRRHYGAWTAATTEHAVLWLYWAVSGYGLRAWRALTTFAFLLMVAASLFAYGGGFAGPTTTTAASPTATTRPGTTAPPSQPTATAATADASFAGGLVYSARTVIGLTRDPQPRLTRFGDVVQILLRILGPVLLGLAVLSVRGRVKR
jgi:uncharacterized protein YjbI with pentapeptide repeats